MHERWGWTPRPPHGPLTDPGMCKANKILRHKSRLGVKEPRSRVAEVFHGAGAALSFIGDIKDYTGTRGNQEAAELHPRARRGSLENRNRRYAEERVLEKMDNPTRHSCRVS